MSRRVEPDGALGGDPPCWAALFEAPDRDIERVADIEELVRSFYRDAAMDDVLGPVFREAGVDWSAHVPKLVDSWTWQLFAARITEGQPLRAHEAAHRRTPFADRHYERWLELFTATVDDRFAGPVAELAKARAPRVASCMRRLLGGVDRRG